MPPPSRGAPPRPPFPRQAKRCEDRPPECDRSPDGDPVGYVKAAILEQSLDGAARSEHRMWRDTEQQQQPHEYGRADGREDRQKDGQENATSSRTPPPSPGTPSPSTACRGR